MSTGAKPVSVIIVGAGIIGSSIAYSLAGRGVRVTVVDTGAPGGGVTGKAMGWINVALDTPRPGETLKRHAVNDWRRLEDVLGSELGVRWDWCWRGVPKQNEPRREHLGFRNAVTMSA